MKVLLVLPRYDLGLEERDFNFGFGYLCSVLRKNQFEVEILNTAPLLISVEEIERRIRETDYDIIGVGGLSIAFNFLEWLIGYIRRVRPETPVILGGGILTASPRLIFDHLKPDYGVVGEGEQTIVELVKCLASGRDVSEVDGLIFWNGESVITTAPRSPIMDLDVLPYPAWDDLNVESVIENSAKDENQRMFHRLGEFRQMTVLASRSCPYLCSFCFHPLGNHYRKRSPESVVEEMKTLIHRYSINYFLMADELFVFDTDWVDRFCRQLIDANLKVLWECNGKVGHGNVETFSLMKSAGCINISHGFESGNDRILSRLNKRFTVSKARKTVKEVRDAGIDTIGGFIIGTPGETRETFRDTVDFIKEMELPVTWFSFVTPYPGTQLYREALEKGLIRDEIDFHRQIWNTQDLLLNFTDISDEELIDMKEAALDEIYNYLIGKSTQEIQQAELIDESSSLLRMVCRFCGAREEYVYTVTNTNHNTVLCPKCLRKKLLDPACIPHIRSRIDQFRNRLTQIASEDARVAITPVGVHTKRLLRYTNWSELNTLGFLDGDRSRSRHEFLGYPVYHRTKEALAELQPDYVLVTGHVGIVKSIITHLDDCGIDSRRIVHFLE